MLRLRTTSALSLLAMAIGCAGTGWLSTLTSEWQPGSTPLVQRSPLRDADSKPRQSKHAKHVDGSVSRLVETRWRGARAVAGIKLAVAAAAPDLIPVSMPSDNSQSWQSLRGHLDGQLLMHLQIDDGGHVSEARVAKSSGDAVLDEHALRSVRHWRFALPTDHAEGMEGDLPMRFASADRQLAATP